MVIAFDVANVECVDGSRKVPLVYETSSVDVAVIVTVDSVVVPLLLSGAKGIEVIVVPANVEEVNVVSLGSGVVGGVELSTDCEVSNTFVVIAEVSIGVGVGATGTVSTPNEFTETRTSLVAAATTVASSVVEPTLTLTSTTLAVTVASGTRGTR